MKKKFADARLLPATLALVVALTTCRLDSKEADLFPGLPTIPQFLESAELPALNIEVPSDDLVLINNDTAHATWYPLAGQDYNFTLYKPGSTVSLSGSTKMRGRGNSSWMWEKKPFNLKLTTKAALLGMENSRRWCLLANYTDKTLIRNDVAFKMASLFTKLKWSPRVRSIGLYINGEFQGIYDLAESISAGGGKVNVTKKLSDDNPEGGFLLEIDMRRSEEINFLVTTPPQVGSQPLWFCLSDPDSDLSDPVIESVKAKVVAAQDAIFGEEFFDAEYMPTATDIRDRKYYQYFDVGSLVDWYLFNEIVKSTDACFGTSVFMYYDDKDGKFHMGPLWDFDLSMGNNKAINQYGNKNYENFHTDRFWIAINTSWYYMLMADPLFMNEVMMRLYEKWGQIKDILKYVDKQSAAMKNAQVYNFRKWDINQSITAIGIATEPLGSYDREVDYLRDWLIRRFEWLQASFQNYWPTLTNQSMEFQVPANAQPPG
jgi:hypothetical protein